MGSMLKENVACAKNVYIRRTQLGDPAMRWIEIKSLQHLISFDVSTRLHWF